MSEKRLIVVNTLANGVAQFAAMLSALVFMPFLVRSFGIGDYGLYLLASSVVGYAVILDFGVSAAVGKTTAEAAAQGDTDRLGRTISSALAFYTLVGIVVFSIMAVLAFNTGSLFKVSADGARLLRNLFLLAGTVSLVAWPSSIAGQVLGGFQKFTQTARVSVAQTIGTIAVTATVVVLHEGPVVLMAATAAVGIAGSLVNIVLARRALGRIRVSLSLADVSGMRAIFSFAWAVFVIQICTIILYQQTDRLVLGIFIGGTAIALYEAAGKFQGFVSQLSSFSVSAVMPMASHLGAQDRKAALTTLFLRGTKYSIALLAPVVVVLLVIARPLLLSWLGPTFAGQALAAQILISHQVLTAGVTLGDAMMIGLGRLPRRVPYAIGLALLNLVLSLALVRSLGILGVVLGTAIPYFIDYPLHMRLLLKVLEVPPGRWLRETIAPTYPLLLLPLGISLWLVSTGLAASMLGLAAIGALSVGSYWCALLLFGFNDIERAEVRSVADSALRRLTGAREHE